MSDNGDSERKGIIHMVLDGMNPTVKAIVFSLLAFPVFLALSGKIVDINVGAIITSELERSREKTVSSVRHSIDSRVDELSKTISDYQISTMREISELKVSVDKALEGVDTAKTRIDDIERRLGSMDTEIGKIKSHICDNDGKPPHECTIDGYGGQR